MTCALVSAWSAPTAGGPQAEYMALRSGFAVRIVCAWLKPFVWSQSVSSLPTIFSLAFIAPRPASMPFTRSSSEGMPGTPARIAELVARLEPRREVLAGEHAAVEVVRGDDRGLAFPGRDVVVDQHDLDAVLLRRLERGHHGRARRRDRDALHACRDHVLDRRDLTRVVGRALSLAEEDLRAGRLLVELLRPVLQRRSRSRPGTW